MNAPMPHTPMFSLLEIVELEQNDGESLLDTATRVLVAEALVEAKGSQRDAAKALGITPRVMHYHVLHRLKLQPKRGNGGRRARS